MKTFDLQKAAMAVSRASPAEKHVLLVLALRAAEGDATCHPGIPKLAKDTGLSERHVHRAIVALEQAGHITREVKVGVGTIYTVHPCHHVTPDMASPLTQGQSTPDTVSSKLPRTTISQKTSSSSKARARSAASIELPDWVPVDAWNGWLEMRRGKGGKETARALTMAIERLRKLADDGHPPGEVLDQSTFSRWTGLFPIKDYRNEQSRSPGRSSPARGSVTAAVAAAFDRVDFG